MKIKSPRDVRFLAMEGGGGKGVTYLGAILALEAHGVLPIRIDRPGQNQIKGLSGASAGAITSLLLGMGATAKQIAEILSHSATFNGFFDGPDPGLFRSVDRRNKPQIQSERPDGIRPRDFLGPRFDAMGGVATAVDAAGLLAQMFSSPTDPVAKHILRLRDQYLYNLVYDRGLFPGFAPRAFLAGIVSEFLKAKIREVAGGASPSPNGGDLNFEQFEQMTGVELVITGANVTKRRPMVFSRRHTPHFPVAEAVGISMNLPMVFKPVKVDALVTPSALVQNADDYQGFWVDGGLLNNFPLHAFDHYSPKVSSQFPELRPLNPNMLGLRLTEGPPGFNKQKESRSLFSALQEHFGNIVETLMFPSEQGQIRTIAEIEQTIDLYTYDLQTTEFAPSEEKRKEPIQRAELAVNAYFKL